MNCLCQPLSSSSFCICYKDASWLMSLLFLLIHQANPLLSLSVWKRLIWSWSIPTNSTTLHWTTHTLSGSALQVQYTIGDTSVTIFFWCWHFQHLMAQRKKLLIVLILPRIFPPFFLCHHNIDDLWARLVLKIKKCNLLLTFCQRL